MKKGNKKKKKIGYTTGVFDLFHVGHLNIIKRAKKSCDKLVVGVTTDKLTEKRKGKKPIIPFEERVRILEEMRSVDKVVPQEEINELRDQKKIKFDIIFKGSDWEGTKRWKNLEKEFKKRGVEVKYFPYTKTTSSTLLNKLIEKELGKNKKNPKLENYKVFVHLGLHKTGTTFLQEEIFKKIKDVNYIPGGGENILKTTIVKDKINLISLESLSGKPYAIANNEDTRFITTYRLCKMFPNAKIIIGTREKESWLKSLYKESVVKGNDKKYKEWKKLINPSYLDVESYVSYLKKLFPEVYEFKYENFKKDKDKEIKKLCDFMEVEVPKYQDKKHRKSFSNKKLNIYMFFNKFVHSRFFHPERKIPRFWSAIPAIRS
jgi:glycerol-3-phosphate cytidylyltransferase